jgi:hypothetical protein
VHSVTVQVRTDCWLEQTDSTQHQPQVQAPLRELQPPRVRVRSPLRVQMGLKLQRVEVVKGLCVILTLPLQRVEVVKGL